MNRSGKMRSRESPPEPWGLSGGWARDRGVFPERRALVYDLAKGPGKPSRIGDCEAAGPGVVGEEGVVPALMLDELPPEAVRVWNSPHVLLDRMVRLAELLESQVVMDMGEGYLRWRFSPEVKF